MIKNNYTNILLFFTLVTIDAAAQNYIPIPEANAMWNVHEQSFMPCGSSEFQWANEDKTITINGDTIINGFTYKKLYSTGHFYTTSVFPNPPQYCNDNLDYYFYNVYYGAFRNDIAAKQVMFFLNSYPSECLMFDFNLNIGSSLTSISCMMNPPNGIVLADTSIVLGGVSRRVLTYGYNYSSSFGFETSTIIEGIGSLSAGLIDKYHHFEWSSTLLCFSVNNVTIYPDSFSTCDIIDAVKEPLADENIISIFPNPFSESSTVLFNKPLYNATFSLYSLPGEKVAETTGINGESFQLNRGNLSSGIYLFDVREKEKSIGRGKVAIY